MREGHKRESDHADTMTEKYGEDGKTKTKITLFIHKLLFYQKTND